MDIKDEPMDDALSPEDDIYEDAGDLEFTGVHQSVWLTHLPKSLWETLSTLDGDDEIEIGTLRVEGSDKQPTRISFRLENTPQLQSHPKEYKLLPRDKRAGQAFVFSQKDATSTFNDGEHGRSYLYERNKRDRQRKENKEQGKKFEPYARKPVAKQTAIAGIVEKALECVPVKNAEFYVLEAEETKSKLKIPERPQAIFGKSGNRQPQYMLSQSERKKITQAGQAKKQKAKDDRSARVSRADLIDKLLQCFKTHRIWGLRDLKAVVNQPEQYVREVLQEIAFMWKSGDWNGKYELKDEYKAQDASLQNPTNSEVAPEAAMDSDFDMTDDTNKDGEGI